MNNNNLLLWMNTVFSAWSVLWVEEPPKIGFEMDKKVKFFFIFALCCYCILLITFPGNNLIRFSPFDALCYCMHLQFFFRNQFEIQQIKEYVRNKNQVFALVFSKNIWIIVEILIFLHFKQNAGKKTTTRSSR